MSFETLTSYLQGGLNEDEMEYVRREIENDEFYQRTIEGFVEIGNKHLLFNTISSISSRVDQVLDEFDPSSVSSGREVESTVAEAEDILAEAEAAQLASEMDEAAIETPAEEELLEQVPETPETVGEEAHAEETFEETAYVSQPEPLEEREPITAEEVMSSPPPPPPIEEPEVYASPVEEYIAAEERQPTPWLRYLMAAASVVLFIGAGYMLIQEFSQRSQLARNENYQPEIARQGAAEAAAAEEIAPVEEAIGGGAVAEATNTEDDLNLNVPVSPDEVVQAEEPIIAAVNEVEPAAEAFTPPAEADGNLDAAEGMATGGAEAAKTKAAPVIIKQSISGRVTDPDGEALLGVDVLLNGKTVTKTNQNGRFDMTVDKGVHKFDFAYDGYSTSTKQIIAQKDNLSKKLNVVMKQNPQPVAAVARNEPEPEIVSTTKLSSSEPAAPVNEPAPYADVLERISKLSPQKQVQQGMQSYSLGKYGEAAFIFDHVLKSNAGLADALFYSGMSNMNNGNNNRAIMRFDALIADPVHHYYDEAMWYKAQTLIKQGKKEIAKPILQQLASSTNQFQGRSKALLNVMY